MKGDEDWKSELEIEEEEGVEIWRKRGIFNEKKLKHVFFLSMHKQSWRSGFHNRGGGGEKDYQYCYKFAIY